MYGSSVYPLYSGGSRGKMGGGGELVLTFFPNLNFLNIDNNCQNIDILHSKFTRVDPCKL